MLSTALFNKIKSHITERERGKVDKRIIYLEDENAKLHKIIKEKDKIISELQKQIQVLLKRIEKLELNQKTYKGMIFKTKSEKDDDDPPTSTQSPPRGGVVGHKGDSRHTPSRVDRTVNVDKLDRCPKCNSPLKNLKSMVTHFVEDIELPFLNTLITKYTKQRQFCEQCNKECSAHDKEEIPNARFGVNLMSLIMYLRYESKLTLPLISSLLKLLGGIKITPSGVENQLEIAKVKLGESYKEILQKIRGSPVKHADETGWKVEGDQYWAWMFSTQEETYLGIAPSRGKGIAQDYLASSNPDSVLVRDGYAGYDSLNMKTQYCWAHVLRYARDFAKYDDSSPEIKRMSNELNRIFHYMENNYGKKAYVYVLKRLTAMSNRETNDEAVRRVQVRLRKQSKGLLTALIVRGVPLTNNQAERDIRPLVVSRKISYGSMSENGAETTAVNYSIIQTLKKLQLPIFESIPKLLTGENIYSLQEKG
jgi:hypothetical protein